jgi:N-acetyl-anhydromuramyl-L-alanine amidase AmpD
VATAAARVRAVWISLLAAMTLVGGLLMLLDGRPVPRIDGLSLSPLAATGWAGGEGGGDPVLLARRPLDRARWQAVVIHHSGSTVGTPASIEAEHQSRNLRGLGHHFIIGNGHGMEDGQVHVGYRWLDQLPGAHAAGPHGEAYNQRGISICLVGDGNRRPFTDGQLRQLSSLLGTIRREFGVPPERVLLHSEVADVADPGRLFPAGRLRAEVPTIPPR